MSKEPTIFISHSTSKLPKTDDSVRLKEALQLRLQAKGWRVFIDSQSVSGGDLWRTEILHTLATAKAGIILLNDDASKSDWVKAEALIMCFRKSINRNFPLLPIVLPGANLDATFIKTYEPFQFNEIQKAMATFAGGQSIDDFAQTVADNPVLEQGRQSEAQGADWVQKVVNIMAGLKPDALCQIVEKMKLIAEPDLLTPLPSEELCLRVRWALANLLHHESPQTCLTALQILTGHLSEGRARQLKPHLLSKWVDNESAEILLLAAREPEQQGLLALNTSKQQVVDRYTERLTTELPIPGPIVPLISVPGPKGDFDEAGLKRLVEKAIALKLDPLELSDENDKEQSLQAVVAAQLQPDKFAVCILPKQFSNKSLLKELRSRFSRIIFIALSGDKGEATAECLEAGGRSLSPTLTLQKITELSQLFVNYDALFDQKYPKPG